MLLVQAFPSTVDGPRNSSMSVFAGRYEFRLTLQLGEGLSRGEAGEIYARA